MTGRGGDPLAVVRDLVREHLPDLRVDSVVLLGEGLDNRAHEVDGELIVRCAKEPDAARRAALVTREARLLAAVADVSPLPVPEPLFTDAERGALAYRKLPGVPLLDLPPHLRSAHAVPVAAVLGELLAALHAVPVGRLAGLVETDVRAPAEWRNEAAEHHATVAARVPAAYRGPVDAFLDAPPPQGVRTPVFSHNDLGIEHVLVDPLTRRVTGVIDWTDAALVDPARDFGLLHRDLGPAATRAALDRYRPGADTLAALTGRAVFYACCGVFEDLVHGIETGQEKYVEKSLAAMEWLFPPRAPR